MLFNRTTKSSQYFKKFFLFSLSISSYLTISISHSSTSKANKYSPHIQIEGKLGNRRSIVRPGVLVPLYQQSNSLIHMSLIGMSDTRHALEGNMGIGVRHLLRKNIFGLYGFYDIRNSSRDNTIHQTTLGFEWFREYFEFRVNIYLPERKKFVTSSITSKSHYRKSGSSIDIELNNTKHVEQALRGFDIDIGLQPPSLDSLTIRGAYYRFGNSLSNIETRQGFRGVLSYKFYEILSIDFETSYDNQRKLVLFAGATLGYKFDKANRRYTGLTRLEKKMTLLPIRDIDAVVGEGQENIIIDKAYINNIDEDTTVLIGNLFDHTLTLLDVVDGELRIMVSKYNSENVEISDLINEFVNKDIIRDSKVLTLIIKGDQYDRRIIDVNEIIQNNSTLEIKTNYKRNIKNTEEFINLVNLLSLHAINIGRMTIKEEINQELLNALSKQNELEERLRQLQKEIENNRAKSELKLKHAQQLAKQEYDKLIQQLHQQQNNTLIQEQLLRDELIRIQTENSDHQEQLQQQINREHSIMLKKERELIQQLEQNEKSFFLEKQHLEDDILQLIEKTNTQKQQWEKRFRTQENIAMQEHSMLSNRIDQIQDTDSSEKQELQHKLEKIQRQLEVQKQQWQNQLEKNHLLMLEKESELKQQLLNNTHLQNYAQRAVRDKSEVTKQFQENSAAILLENQRLQDELNKLKQKAELEQKQWEEQLEFAEQNAVQRQLKLTHQFQQKHSSNLLEKQNLQGALNRLKKESKLKQQQWEEQLRLAKQTSLHKQSTLTKQLHQNKSLSISEKNKLQNKLHRLQEEAELKQQQWENQSRLAKQTALEEQSELTQQFQQQRSRALLEKQNLENELNRIKREYKLKQQQWISQSRLAQEKALKKQSELAKQLQQNKILSLSEKQKLQNNLKQLQKNTALEHYEWQKQAQIAHNEALLKQTSLNKQIKQYQNEILLLRKDIMTKQQELENKSQDLLVVTSSGREKMLNYAHKITQQEMEILLLKRRIESQERAIINQQSMSHKELQENMDDLNSTVKRQSIHIQQLSTNNSWLPKILTFIPNEN